MKKIFSISLLALPSSLFAQATKIKIDVDRTIAWIDLKIYGMDELQTLPGTIAQKLFK
jgi:hypothetical protein